MFCQLNIIGWFYAQGVLSNIWLAIFSGVNPRLRTITLLFKLQALSLGAQTPTDHVVLSIGGAKGGGGAARVSDFDVVCAPVADFAPSKLILHRVLYIAFIFANGQSIAVLPRKSKFLLFNKKLNFFIIKPRISYLFIIYILYYFY